VVGAGYVGLTTAAVFAQRGHEVWCIDSDPVRIDELRRGHVPISERGLPEAIAANRDRLHFEIAVGPGPALEHVRLVFVAVGTPYDDEVGPDLSRVDCVIDSMPASDEHAIVMKSTVPPGTGVRLQSQLEGRGVAYVSCPEFLQEGKALEQFGAPDRVVIGSPVGSWAGDAVEELHQSLDVRAWLKTDITSAEMIKLANNLHLATRVSFINEVANMCEELGADVEQVATGVGLDERIGPSFLSAGLGSGGSCLIKDVKALAHAARDRGYGSSTIPTSTRSSCAIALRR
jgi:UDPglucose 6-dehydrogenase